MIKFSEYLLNQKIYESAKSDKYEIDVANVIQQYANDNNLNWIAERPKATTSYSDVRVTADDTTAWIEVKMNVTDNLGTPRFYYDSGKWLSNMHTVIADDICNMLNKSLEAKKFITELSEFTKIPKDKLYLSPYKSEIIKADNPNMVTLQQLIDFADFKNTRYILKSTYSNVSNIVAKHYLHGKTEPAQYIQIGDNFYMFDDNENPLHFTNVPVLKGDGILNIRFSTRSQFYEIISEIKFNMNITKSNVSFMPNSLKEFPSAE